MFCEFASLLHSNVEDDDEAEAPIKMLVVVRTAVKACAESPLTFCDMMLRMLFNTV